MSADNLFATAVAITREHAERYRSPVGPTLADTHATPAPAEGGKSE